MAPVGRKTHLRLSAWAMSLCLVACAAEQGHKADDKMRIVASVNGDAITLGELRRSYYKRTLDRDGGGGVGVGSETLLLTATQQDLMERKLLTQAARSQHLAIFTAEVEAAWQQFIYRWDATALSTMLRELRVSPLGLKEDLRETLLAQKYLQHMVEERVAVLDIEIERYLSDHNELMIEPEAVRLRHMVLPDEMAGKSALAAIKGGESFAQVATTRSLAKDAPQGGDMGLVHHNELPGSVAQVVFSLPSRRASAPMFLCDGVHLFYVVEKFPKKALSLAQARPRAEAILRQRQVAQAKKDHLDALLGAATLVAYDVGVDDVL